MIVSGSVISIEHNTQIKKKAGGTYPGTQFVYKESDGSIKSQAFHEKALGYNEELAKALKALAANDAFEMEKEKEGDFWQVRSIKKVNNVTPITAAGKPSANGAANSHVSDDVRQRLIVRQNVLGHAINMLNYSSQEINTFTVTDLASQLEEFVFTGKVASEKEKATAALEDLDDDIPF